MLNLSLGSDHFSDGEKDCGLTGPNCAITEAVEYAVEHGMVLVAAVGNGPNAEAVCCPALSEETIAVGGCVVKCTATMPNNGMVGASTFHPPHSYWVERPDGSGISGTFCGTNGCAPNEPCSDNQSIEVWEGNTRFVYHTPDTLAPVTFPRVDEQGLMMGSGTSFATPVVTAAIVTAMEVLLQEDITPNPSRIRRIIRVTGNELPDVPVGVLNAKQFTDELFDQHGLAPLRPDNSNSIYRM